MAAFKKILFIDDDIITVTVCERMMKLVNFTDNFVSCEDGRKAQDYLLGNRNALPDIIFVDLNMSIMNGWEFIKWFNESGTPHSNIPVYILSSSLYKEDYDKIDSYKTAGSIIKPITAEHLSQISEKYSA